MDARKDRIGEHAAENAPPWAVTALGPVPEDPLDRLDWQKRAAAIGAWRELSGYRHPADPIGPEPVAAAPDLRAAWHEALAALGPVDGPDVRGMPDGRLCTCATPTRSRPPGHRNTWAMSSVRSAPPPARPAWPACAPAPKPPPPPRTATPTPPPASRSLRSATTPCTRPTGSARPSSPRPWPTGPTGTPPPAPSATWPSPPTPNSAAATPASPSPAPLRRTRTRPATETQRAELTLTPGEPPGEMGQWIKDLAAAHRTFAERLANLQSLTIPSKNPDYGDLGQAFPPWPRQATDAILQPPKPEIRPSPYVLERAADRDADWEAAD